MRRITQVAQTWFACAALHNTIIEEETEIVDEDAFAESVALAIDLGHFYEGQQTPLPTAGAGDYKEAQEQCARGSLRSMAFDHMVSVVEILRGDVDRNINENEELARAIMARKCTSEAGCRCVACVMGTRHEVASVIDE